MRCSLHSQLSNCANIWMNIEYRCWHCLSTVRKGAKSVIKKPIFPILFAYIVIWSFRTYLTLLDRDQKYNFLSLTFFFFLGNWIVPLMMYTSIYLQDIFMFVLFLFLVVYLYLLSLFRPSLNLLCLYWYILVFIIIILCIYGCL